MGKDISIRASLSAGAYIGGLRQMGNATTAYAREAGESLRKHVVDGGLKELGRGLKDTGRELGQLLKYGATIGGAFSFEEGVRSAVKVKASLGDLAFLLSEGERKQVSWNDVHAELSPIVDKTTRSVEELAAAYTAIYEETGNRDVAVGSLEAIGTIANASGKSVEKLAGIAGALNDKFKITAKQMPEALAMLMELASKGGIKFDELENFINTTGASALAAGLSGENGLKKMIAMANIGGDALKNMQKGVKTISSLFDSMVDPGVSKKIEQVFRVKTKDNAGNARDSTKVLEDIMARTKGEREKLAKVFSGEQLKLVVALSQDFVRGFNEQQGTTKEKLAHAREEFSQGLADAAKTANDYASIQKQANDRIDRDPAAAIRRATNKLGEAFLNPKMIGAIDRISAKLPELAEKLASFTEFAVDHPVAAGGAIIGGKVAAAVLPSVVGGAAVSVVKSIAATAKGAQAAGAIGQGFAGLGGTAAVAGTGTAAAGAGAGPLAAAAAFLGPIGAALAAVAGSGAAIYNGKKLYDENKGSGGILKNFGDAWNGRSSRASTPEEFDRMAREHAPPTTPRAAETEKVAESVKKHGHESDKAAASMARLGRESDRLASYFSTLGKATEAGPGGPSKGPRPLGAPGPGSAMKPPSA